MKPVGEVELFQGITAACAGNIYGRTRAAASISGHTNLNLGQRVGPVLEALQAASPNRFRGIRHSVTGDRHPDVPKTAEAKLPSGAGRSPAVAAAAWIGSGRRHLVRGPGVDVDAGAWVATAVDEAPHGVNGTRIEFDTEPAVTLTMAGPITPIGTVTLPTGYFTVPCSSP